VLSRLPNPNTHLPAGLGQALVGGLRGSIPLYLAPTSCSTVEFRPAPEATHCQRVAHVIMLASLQFGRAPTSDLLRRAGRPYMAQSHQGALRAANASLPPVPLRERPLGPLTLYLSPLLAARLLLCCLELAQKRPSISLLLRELGPHAPSHLHG
jgi:hypothetical protein